MNKHDISNALMESIQKQGFHIDDCPFLPIKTEWEQFPIIKAIRQAEKETGIKYSLTDIHEC